jgi:phytoene dehydrogenase-like protein
LRPGSSCQHVISICPHDSPTGLPPDLELHHIVVNSWEPAVDSEQNVVLISIPSVKDPKLAPAGKHTLHAYLPATEPFAIWEGAHTASGLLPEHCDHA